MIRSFNNKYENNSWSVQEIQIERYKMNNLLPTTNGWSE